MAEITEKKNAKSVFETIWETKKQHNRTNTQQPQDKEHFEIEDRIGPIM